MKGNNAYYLKREEKIRQLLSVPDQKFRSDTFHELRVEIKKVYAFIELIHFCSKKFKRKKVKKALRNIFDVAGKVRELDVLLESIRPGKAALKLPEFIRMINKIRLDAKADFFKLSGKIVQKDLKKLNKMISAALKEIKKKNVADYFFQNKNELEIKLAGNLFFDEDLHKLRKQLKIYFYNLRFIGKGKAGNDQLSESIGEWHDCQVNIGYLRMGKKSVKDKKEVAEIQKLIEGQLNKRKKLADEIRLLATQTKLPTVSIADIKF